MKTVADNSNSNPLSPPQAHGVLPSPNPHGRIRRILRKQLPLWTLLLTGTLALGARRGERQWPSRQGRRCRRGGK